MSSFHCFTSLQPSPPHPQILLPSSFIWITAPNFPIPPHSLQHFLTLFFLQLPHRSCFSHTFIGFTSPVTFSPKSFMWERWVSATWGFMAPNILESCWKYPIYGTWSKPPFHRIPLFLLYLWNSLRGLGFLVIWFPFPINSWLIYFSPHIITKCFWHAGLPLGGPAPDFLNSSKIILMEDYTWHILMLGWVVLRAYSEVLGTTWNCLWVIAVVKTVWSHSPFLLPFSLLEHSPHLSPSYPVFRLPSSTLAPGQEVPSLMESTSGLCAPHLVSGHNHYSSLFLSNRDIVMFSQRENQLLQRWIALCP